MKEFWSYTQTYIVFLNTNYITLQKRTDQITFFYIVNDFFLVMAILFTINWTFIMYQLLVKHFIYIISLIHSTHPVCRQRKELRGIKQLDKKFSQQELKPEFKLRWSDSRTQTFNLLRLWIWFSGRPVTLLSNLVTDSTFNSVRLIKVISSI